MDEKIVWEFFKTCHRIHNHSLKIFQDRFQHKLPAVEMWIIHALKRSPSCKTTDLARNLGIPCSTLTGILDRMEKKGLVVRSRTPDDRRVVLVTLGKTILENREAIEELILEVFNPAKSSFPEEWWIHMTEELKKIDAILLASDGEVINESRNSTNTSS